ESFATSGGHGRAGSQIAIDSLHLLPTQSPHPLGHLILKTLALLILPYLFVGGLAQVDDRFARQVFRLDLGTVQNLCHQLLLLRERPPSECWPCDRSDGRVSFRPSARQPFLSGSSGPEVVVAPR